MDDATKLAEQQSGKGDAPSPAGSEPFVGRWNRLVSTTNWEKGRIICEWRKSLESRKAPAREYSDDAWGRLVGCVTAQHVGRLRRVYQRFGKTYQDYEGLYWSHFQAAVEWDDAEMYLEGAIRNDWSVSQMRRTRWEAMGAVDSQQPHDQDIVEAELDEDFETAETSPPDKDTVTAGYGEVADPKKGSRPSSDDEGDDDAGPVDDVASQRDQPAGAVTAAVRPFEDLGELPSDVSEAFEQMKLAILRHKADGWKAIARDEMLGALDALKELALAPPAAGTSS